MNLHHRSDECCLLGNCSQDGIEGNLATPGSSLQLDGCVSGVRTNAWS
jgi:hypothetical protein